MKRLVPFLGLSCLISACAGDDTPPDVACLDTEALTLLDEHAESLRASAGMLAGHPGAREAIGFFLFPGLEVQRSAVYAGPLIMECSEPLLYDEFCEEDGLCSQIECTGAGASWEMHFWLADAVPADISYGTASVDTSWTEGDTGITFTSASQAAGADERDWSMTGSGSMNLDAFEVQEEYGSLIDGSAVVLTISDDDQGNHAGAITLDGDVVAAPDADGTYTAVEACR